MKKQQRKRPAVAVLAAASALGIVLTGCTSQTDADTSAAGRCPAIADKPAVGNGTIVYWSMFTEGEPTQKVLQKTFDCFENETGIHVDAQWFGRAVLSEHVAPALNTNKVPDLIDGDISLVAASVGKPGGLQSVDDVLDLKVSEGESTVGDVLSKAVYDLSYNKLPDGGLQLVPYMTLGKAWWYNKDVVPDFKAPTTTDELFALFDAAKADGKAAVALDGDIDDYNAYFFTQWAEQYVGTGGLLAAAKDPTGQAWKAEPGFLAAAKNVGRLAEGGYLIDGWDANKWPAVQQRWADGKAGYLLMGSWITSEASEYLKKQNGGVVDDKLNVASFPLPMAEGATHKTVEILPIGFGVTKKAANPDATKALIAYALNKANITPIATEAQELVPRADVAAPAGLEGVSSALEDPAAEPVVFMDGLDGQAADWTKEVFYPLDKQLLQGKLTAEQFINNLVEKQQNFY